MKYAKFFLILLLGLSLVQCTGMGGGEVDEDSGLGASSIDGAGKDLSDEEKAELKQKQKQIGGDYGKLGKFYKAKRFRELMQEAGKILSKDPNDLKALSALGLYHMSQGQNGAARIFFERALKKHPDEAGLVNNIGVIQLREDDLASAFESFKKAYELSSSNPNVLANLGSIYVKYLDYIEAEPMVEDAYSYMPSNKIVANNYAIVLRTQGQLEEAEKVYKQALQKNSRDITTNLNYAILLVEYMKKYDKARQVVDKMEFLNPTDKYVLSKIQDLQRKVRAAK